VGANGRFPWSTKKAERTRVLATQVHVTTIANFGERLRRWCKETGVTRSELARRMDIVPGNISNWGIQESITVDQLVKLSQAMGVDSTFWTNGLSIEQQAEESRWQSNLQLQADLTAAKKLADRIEAEDALQAERDAETERINRAERIFGPPRMGRRKGP